MTLSFITIKVSSPPTSREIVRSLVPSYIPKSTGAAESLFHLMFHLRRSNVRASLIATARPDADELSPALSDYIFAVIIHILHLLVIRSMAANTMGAAENSVVAHAPNDTHCATETKNNFLVSQSGTENISLYFLGYG